MDITERVQLAAQIQQTRKMEAIGTLAAGIAHDFNNILSAVIGFSELSLDESRENEALHDNIREILQAGYRAKELVHHILTFSRQAQPEFTSTQIKPLLKEALKFLRATLPASIEVKQNFQSDAAVWGDPTQVHQIIMNLCTNAAQAMGTGGTLSVGLKDATLEQEDENNGQDLRPGKYVVLSVSDTGSGMSSAIMDRIFDPFFTTKEKGEGTGMGLSVVHGIVSECGGKVLADSQPGKGTSFQVYLPVFQERRKRREGPPTCLPTGGERILVVDDEPAVAKAAGRMLASLGYRIKTCTEAAVAEQWFAEQPDRFDLVITDMIMPKLNGDVLAESLLKIKADLPIILLTGFGEKIEDSKIQKIGIRAVVKKPFLKRTLAEAVRKVRDRPQPG
jgi:nitrogen-specific signal transduction histidine kinase